MSSYPERKRIGGRKISWVKGTRFTLLPAPEKGFRHLVEGGTYFSKATVVCPFSNYYLISRFNNS
jgi:hypothetical protein